jgi:transcriptional regulator with XRE-family HTH domain
MISIHEKIKEFRERHNYSQEYIGNRLGISQQAYRKIENGTTELKLEILLMLAKIYKVGSYELIGNADSEVQEIFDKQNMEITSLKNEISKLNNIITILQNEIQKLQS